MADREIHLHFRALADIDLESALTLEGVCILWGPYNQSAPGSIGYGKLLDTLADPHYRTAKSVRGVFAQVETKGFPPGRGTLVAEAVIARVASDIGIPATRFRHTARRKGRVRLELSGQDPFSPKGATKLRSPRTIELDASALHRGDEIFLSHPWRSRTRARAS